MAKIRISRAQKAALKNGEITVEQIAGLLLDTYPVKQIAVELVEALLNRNEDVAELKIPIGAAEYAALTSCFKVKADKPEGYVERRGRKKKEK